MTNTSAQIRRKAEPGQVWHLAPGGDLVDAGPEVRQIAVYANEGQDVNRGCDGAAGAEEERHPGEVEGELDGVDGHAVAGGADGVWGGEGREADVCDAVGGVAHHANREASQSKQVRRWEACVKNGGGLRVPIEDGPDGAKDPGRRAQRRLPESHVGLFGL